MIYGVVILEKTYQLEHGEIKQIHSTRQYKLEFKNLLRKVVLMFLYLALFAGVCAVTCVVYRKSIVQMNLDHTISLGAVFATLGSSLVAVSSLACSEQYSQFADNTRILEEKLFNKEKWERWPFVRRLQKNKIAPGEYLYYKLCNPCVIFTFGCRKLTISLPSGKGDFRELPVYQAVFKLMWYRKKYAAMLMSQNRVKDILIWNCLTRIYCNILLYRWNQIIVWIGSYFIFSSIFFSFFYIQIVEFIACRFGAA